MAGGTNVGLAPHLLCRSSTAGIPLSGALAPGAIKFRENRILSDTPHPFTYFADVAALVPSIPPDTIVSRTVLKQGDLQLIVFGFAPGQELSEHTSAKSAVMHFVRGRARLVVGDEPSSAQAGTVVAMQPNTPHSVLAEEETVMLLYMFGGR